MRPARGLLVLAMIAALVGAPSVASAAANTLVNAQASPSTGTIDTEFTLTVTYDGRSDALAVRASVAGRLLDMARIDGTPAAGTWRVRTTLPVGTWPVVFTAVIERGNPPTLAGLSVTVIGLDAAPPTIEATEPADTQPSDGSGTPDQPAGGADAPTATPDEPASPVEGGTASFAPDALPAGTPPPAAPNGTAAAVGTPASGAHEEDERGAPAEQEAPAVQAPSAWPAPVADDETAGEPDPSTEVGEQDLLTTVLVIGLAAVAAVAIGGSALLLAMRRREQRADGPPVPTAAAPPAETPAAPGISEMTDRQALRRARLRMSDDPIMAALGIDEDIAGRRARRRADAAIPDRDGEG